MRHEKIINRPDGSRVRIIVWITTDWTCEKARWACSLEVCEKGKRTWTQVCNVALLNSLSKEDQSELIKKNAILVASIAEIESVMLELWKKLKPEIERTS